ncbi:MAG: trigger factor, partial [Candidatus Kryptoniota bacterium]
MKIDTQPLENHQIKVTVEATPEEYESVRQKAIRQLTKKVKIPGFRPGKAPLAIALKHLDPKLVAEETLEMFIDEYYPKILEEKNIDPYGPGTLEHISPSDPPTMEFVIPLRPHVELGDYRSIRIPYHFEPLDESEVDKALENLRESYAMLEPVERPIKTNDVVYIDILGTTNAEAEKPAETIANFSNYPVQVIGKRDKNKNEWPFPGFSVHLIGKSVNDVVEIDYTFPKNYHVANLKGKAAHFTVTIKEIKQRNLPKLNDEFAQSLGEFANLDELRQSIRNSLEKAKLEEYHEDYDDQ